MTTPQTTPTTAPDGGTAKAERHLSGPLAAVAATGVLGLSFGIGMLPAHADQNVVVMNANDSGAGSLREAIATASAHNGGVITFDPSVTGTISLLSEITIPTDMTIQGPGASVLTISGAAVDQSPAHRIFDIVGGGEAGRLNVVISGVTLSGGVADNNGNGGAVQAETATLTMTAVVVDGNLADGEGAGVFANNTELNVVDSRITGNGDNNTDEGGGIAERNGSLTVTRTTIDNNQAFFYGGGVYARGGFDTEPQVTISASTISHNTAEQGGGLQLTDVSTAIVDSTISGNVASVHTGGGMALYYGSLIVDNSTIADNHSAQGAAGISRLEGDSSGYPGVTLSNSIVADNVVDQTPPEAPALAVTADGDDQISPTADVIATYSLDSDQLLPGTGNITGSPGLAPLGNYGGPTETMLQADDSPVVNTGDPGFTPPPDTDQRGLARVVGTIDMGADEVPAPVAPTTTTTTTAPSSTTTTVEPGAAVQADELARTGRDTTIEAIVGAGLVGMGAAAVASSKRRRRAQPQE